MSRGIRPGSRPRQLRRRSGKTVHTRENALIGTMRTCSPLRRAAVRVRLRMRWHWTHISASIPIEKMPRQTSIVWAARSRSSRRSATRKRRRRASVVTEIAWQQTKPPFLLAPSLGDFNRYLGTSSLDMLTLVCPMLHKSKNEDLSLSCDRFG